MAAEEHIAVVVNRLDSHARSRSSSELYPRPAPQNGS